MSTKQILYIVIVVIIISGLSFYVGMKYASGNQSSRGSAQFSGQFGATGGQRPGGVAGRGGANGGFVSGEILSADANSITVKLRDGGSKIVFFSTSTDIQKTVDGSASDLLVGKQVTVSGLANTDGSITSQSIQLRTTPPTLPEGMSRPVN